MTRNEFDHLLSSIKALTPGQKRRVRQEIDRELSHEEPRGEHAKKPRAGTSSKSVKRARAASATKKPMTRDEFHRHLIEIGLMSRIPDTEAVEPHTFADPELKSPRRYTNLSAAEVRDAWVAKGYSPAKLPSERTMRDILNRMNYRLKRIRKGKPLKKTEETLEISMDAKAKVALGDYVRGEKKPGPTPRVRCPRDGTMTRPRSRS